LTLSTKRNQPLSRQLVPSQLPANGAIEGNPIGRTVQIDDSIRRRSIARFDPASAEFGLLGTPAKNQKVKGVKR